MISLVATVGFSLTVGQPLFLLLGIYGHLSSYQIDSGLCFHGGFVGDLVPFSSSLYARVFV